MCSLISWDRWSFLIRSQQNSQLLTKKIYNNHLIFIFSLQIFSLVTFTCKSVLPKKMCFPLRSFHPLGGQRKKGLELCHTRKKIIIFLPWSILLKRNVFSHEMDANTTQQNTNKAFS